MFEPTTETINNKIAAIAGDKEIKNPWIGIHYIHDENRTVFASHSKTVAWSNWNANEPNNEKNIDACTHLYNGRTEYPCAFGSWIGDGICQEINNNEECYWDGYDCCNHYALTDGFCDDENNKRECGWDGGDCCGNNVKIEYCTVCECHEPNFELKQCKYEQIGNGICNDESNTEECHWDGGDCCEIYANTFTCTVCECHIELMQQIDDGICNDETNTFLYKWDGGDCCGDDVVMTKCSTCECLEPFRWNDDNCDEYRRFICEREETG